MSIETLDPLCAKRVSVEIDDSMKLREHERFWTVKFGKGNARAFERWVPKDTDSRRALRRCVADLRITTILDVGCGLALDYEKYLEDGVPVEYHGIDLTLPFVEEVNRKHPHLDVRLGSVEALPYDDGAFEAVSCRALLEHLSGLETAFREMARVSNRYVIVSWFIPPEERENTIEIAHRGPGLMFYKNSYSLDYVNGKIKEAGLSLISKTDAAPYEIWVLEKTKEEMPEISAMDPYVNDLPSIPIWPDRHAIVLRRCAGKRVLHIGCTDAELLEERYSEGVLLHARLAAVAGELWGIDSDYEGVWTLGMKGFENLLCGDAEHLETLEELAGEQFDVVLAAEILEHLDNPGLFLSGVKSYLTTGGELIVTVPNAFRGDQIEHLLSAQELVHPGHVSWYSYSTLSNLLFRHGYRVIDASMYGYVPACDHSPFFAKGLVFVAQVRGA